MRGKFAIRYAILIVGLLALSAVGTTPSGAASPPQDPGARHWTGREAVRRAGARLPAIAARDGRTAAALEAEFVHDPTLHLDATDHLFYIDPAAPETSASAPEAAGFDPGPSTFLLHSQSGAPRVIYLDFHGATLSGTAWNADFATGGDCDTDPYDTDGSPGTFSAPERETVYGIWQRVAEDYAPFAIDVTTEDPGAAAIDRAGVGDLEYGTRALITKSVSTCPNSMTLFESVCNAACGGIAYSGVFDDPSTHAFYQPALIFQNGVPTEKSEAEAVAHEVGHNLGLHHDGATSGCSGPCTYYAGHGSWGPLMGVSYSKAITTWSAGEYALANNTEDDFSVMQSNGADLRADDHADTRPTATTLSGPTLSGAGTITTRTDADVFAITVTGGASVITASPGPTSPNLDIRLELRDATDTLITASDPPSGSTGSDAATGLGATISRALTAGTYYLWVDDVGTGNVDTGYSDYASVGNYSISGAIDQPLPAVSVADQSLIEGRAGKKVTTTFAVSLSAPQSSSTKVTYSTAAGTASAGSDYATRSGTVTIGAGKTSALVSIKVTGDNNIEGDETFTVNLTGVLTPGVVLADDVGLGTIVDDDTAAAPSVSISDVTAWEGNSLTSNATFTVSLSKPSTTATPVSFTAAGVSATSGTDFVATPGTVTIAKGKTSANVVVVVNGDVTPETDEIFLITLTGTGASGLAINRAIGTGTILDDDILPVNGVSIGSGTLVEGHTGTKTISFPLVLSAPATSTKTIMFHTSAGAATGPPDYVPLTGVKAKTKISSNKTSGTIVVTVNGETTVEGDETFTVVLDSITGSTPIANGTGTATILNDD